MEHEQRDSYLIPPNFIEGGTLLGGMFRTRNVIEAGVLGAAVGLPVLNLGFSLTTRIIIPRPPGPDWRWGEQFVIVHSAVFQLFAKPPSIVPGRSGAGVGRQGAVHAPYLVAE